MSRGVVDNDVQVLFPVAPLQAFDKTQEIVSRVAGGTFSHHGAGGHFQGRIQAGEESKGTLLNYWNNYVLVPEHRLAENEQPTLRQARLNGPGSQHTLSH